MAIRSLISVIIPVCNEVKYFKEAIESIINQTYKLIEIIVIDSSDDKKIVPNMIPKDARIKYYWTPKNGIASALNYGIEKSKGEYIARMDADDISSLDRFQLQVELLENNNDISLVTGLYSIIDSNGNLIEEKNRVFTHEEICANIIFENPICHPAVMFRRNIIDDGYNYPRVVAEDYALWTELLPRYRFAMVDKNIFWWRRSDTANTKLMLDKVCQSDIESARQYVKRVFNIEVSNYSNDAFIKNYFRGIIEDAYEAKGKDYIVEQYSLLQEIVVQSPLDIKKQIISEINKRWQIVTANVCVVIPEMQQVLEHSFQTEEELDIERIFNNNNSAIEMILNSNVRVLLWGLGCDGKRAMSVILNAKDKMTISWQLPTLVDRFVRNITINGKDYEVKSPNEVDIYGFDFILVSSKKYYSEIEQELLEMGIPKEKIINYGIITLLNK